MVEPKRVVPELSTATAMSNASRMLRILDPVSLVHSLIPLVGTPEMDPLAVKLLDNRLCMPM